MLSPPSLPAPEKASYDPLVKSSKPEEGSFFLRGSPVLLPFLPCTPNPFWVLSEGSKASSNPFKERVRELSLNNNGGLGEAVRLLQAEARDLISQNVFLAMKMDELKKQLESVSCVPKHLCRSSF